MDSVQVWRQSSNFFQSCMRVLPLHACFSVSATQWQDCVCRDDVDHNGKAIDWGKWAITNNDPDFRGDGNPDTGEDYGAAPGV